MTKWRMGSWLGACLSLAAVSMSWAADAPPGCAWNVGLARVKITPPQSIVRLGYGDRTRPFEAVAADIYAKAIAIEDQRGHRGVIVTADLVGFQAAVVTDEVCRRLAARTGLERRQLLFNASHTHTGPLVSLHPHLQANSVAHPPLTPEDAQATVAYTRQLQDQLVDLVCEALRQLQPARLAWGRGEVGFPLNRRLPQDGRIVMADNPTGPTDRSVPVLRETRQLAREAGRQVPDDLLSATPPFPVLVEKNVRIPLRDGVMLAADIWRPDSAGKFPALLQVSYYVTGPGIAESMVPRGYVCILANSRGRGGSEGDWDPYVNEPRDVFDAQEWVAQQPWCNGRVGMFGQSYNAFTQTMSAPLANPHFLCMVPVEGQQSFFGHQYNDGVLQLNVVFTHGLFATGATGLQGNIPIRDPHFLQLPLVAAADRVPHPQAQRIKTWLAHASYDEHWKSFSVKDKYHQIQTPAYFVTGWYDNLVHENFRNFRGFRDEGGTPTVRTQTRLRVGPGVHGANPLPLVEYCRWYDFWLKGLPTGIDQEAPLQIFVGGPQPWRDEYEWPLARTQFTKYYLHSSGHANSVAGDGRLSLESPVADTPPDHFVYDPAQPVYTCGGPISTNPEVWGPQDRQAVPARDDILVFTSEPLHEDTEVTGPVDLVLYAASTAVDTDFAATLTDVYPDGRAIHICEGIRGATFRESLEHPTPIEPGKVYQYTVSLWETSHVFEAGHRLRLEVTSSNFPRYARNQNTGLPLGTSAEIQIARQTILHDAVCLSHLVLPVIPAASSCAVAARPDGSWRLTANTARVQGPTLKLAVDAGVLGWWTSEQDEAEWMIDVTQAGRYPVQLNFACESAAAGNRFELIAGAGRLTGQVPATGTWYDQREQTFGAIELSPGPQSVILRSIGPIRGALFDLRAVTLDGP
ncbi:MAG: CocE/NonD family hydrolase [Pirellulaceae bacterium]